MQPRPLQIAITCCTALGRSCAQWFAGSGGAIYYNGGHVGIGTESPSQMLEVANKNAIKLGAAYISGGFRSVNHVAFAANTVYNGSYWTIPNLTATSQLFRFSAEGIYFVATQTPGATDWVYRMTIGSNGYIGIGTTNSHYLLAVNGQIGAKDVIVRNSGWSDYVFQAGYRLWPLSDVKPYIQANHHLPDIPSEAEVKEKGVGIAELQSKLLAKIEELTPHVILQEDENRTLRQHMMGQEEQNRQLNDRIARLEAGAAH